MLEQISIPSPDESGQVIITNVDNPSEIHGQLVSNLEEISQLDVISNDLGEKLKGKIEEYMPKVGEICAAEFAEYGQYFRGVILKVNDNKTADVQFIDYGNKASVSLTKIAPLPQEHSLVAKQAVRFALFPEISEIKFSNDCIDELKICLLNKAASYTILSKEQEIVVAKINIEGEDINARIGKYKVQEERPTQESKPQPEMKQPVSFSFPSPQPQDIDKYTGLPAFALPDRCDVTIQHVENTSLFFAQENSHKRFGQLSELTQLMIEHYAHDKSPYQPQVNELCCGLFDGIWSRCYILSKTASDADAIFIDFGNTSTLALKDVRKIVPQFAQLPSFAFALSLCNSSLAHNVNEKFLQLALNQVFEMKVIARNTPTISVVLLDRQTGDNLEDYLPEPVQNITPPKESVQSEKPPIAETIKQVSTERVMSASIPNLEVPVEGVLAVVNIEGPDCIHGQLIEIYLEQIAQLDIISMEITESLKDSNTAYEPVVGEACAAYFPSFSQYLRVKVNKINDLKKTAEVQSIDYGNSTVASFDDLAALSKEHATVPKQAVHVVLNGISSSEWKNEFDYHLQSILMNKMLNYKVVSPKDNGAFIVDLEAEHKNTQINVTNYLRQHHLATQAKSVQLAALVIPAPISSEQKVEMVAAPSFPAKDELEQQQSHTREPVVTASVIPSKNER